MGDAYKFPACDCGGELVYLTEHVYKVRRKINKNGTLSKRQNIIMELGNSSCYGYEYLRCQMCDKEFIYDYDSKNKIINLRETD